MPYLVHFNYRSKDVWVATGRYFVQQKAEQKDICYSKTGSSQWPLQTCKDMQMIDKAKKLWWELAPLRATDTAHFGVSSSTLLQQPNRSIFLHLHKVKITTSHGEQVMCQNREEIKGNKSDIFPPDKHRQTRSRELGRHPGSSRSQGTAPHSDACWGPAAAGSLRPVTQFHLLLLLLSSQYLVTQIQPTLLLLFCWPGYKKPVCLAGESKSCAKSDPKPQNTFLLWNNVSLLE